VGRAPSGGRGPYPHLTTRGVAGPSLHRGGLLRAEPRRARSTAACRAIREGGRTFFLHRGCLTGECARRRGRPYIAAHRAGPHRLASPAQSDRTTRPLRSVQRGPTALLCALPCTAQHGRHAQAAAAPPPRQRTVDRRHHARDARRRDAGWLFPSIDLPRPARARQQLLIITAAGGPAYIVVVAG
jgi:hypothetical protein